VFNLLAEEGRFYGFPVYGVPGFKFGKYHHLQEQGRADEVDWRVHDRDEELLRGFAARYFPDGCGPTMDLQACMFTNTPDKHFILDMHPEYPQVALASPCSGHGFKFASVVGEVMADLAETGTTRHDTRFFGLERLFTERHASDGRAETNGKSARTRPSGRGFRRSEEVETFW
jgi:sarcosine oxidase